MARGRPPKPREQREAEGRTGHRPLPPPVVVGPRLLRAVPDPPKGLGRPAAALWRELAAILTDANMLQTSDLVMLEGLVVMIARARQARAELAGQELVVAGARGGMVVNALLRVERDAWQHALRIAVEFGLTPSARARLGLAINQGRTLQADLDARMGENLAEIPDSVTVAGVVPIDRKRRKSSA